MKNKLIWIALANLLFFGCTKTIKIDNRTQVVSEEPVRYYEEVPAYELRHINERRTVLHEVPYIEEPVSVASTKPFNISPLDVFDKIFENPNILLLDVRLVEEIPQDGKIANSVLIPLQVLGQNLNRLDKSKEIIVYCHTGNRSVDATKLLRRHGFNAVNMAGGIEEWKRAHLSVKWK